MGMVIEGRRRFWKGADGREGNARAQKIFSWCVNFLFRINSPGNSLLWERGQGPHQPVQGRGSQASRIGQPFKFEP